MISKPRRVLGDGLLDAETGLDAEFVPGAADIHVTVGPLERTGVPQLARERGARYGALDGIEQLVGSYGPAPADVVDAMLGRSGTMDRRDRPCAVLDIAQVEPTEQLRR